MAKRISTVMTFAAGLFFLAVTPASAQWAVFGTGGVTFPTGDFGDAADNGWLVSGGVGYALGESGNVALIGEGLYGSSDRDGPGQSDIFGALAHLEYYLTESGMVSVFGGGGILVNEFDRSGGGSVSDKQIALNGGVSVGIPLSESVGTFVLARYIYGFDSLDLFNVQAGIAVPIGGDGM